MVAVTFIAADGAETRIEASEGLSLMENAIGQGVQAIEAVCSGNAYCGTCRVYIAPEWRECVGPASDIELPMFEVTGDETPGIRLSCQVMITSDLDGLVVRTPETQS